MIRHMKATETERGNGKYKTHDHAWNDLVHYSWPCFAYFNKIWKCLNPQIIYRWGFKGYVSDQNDKCLIWPWDTCHSTTKTCVESWLI